MTKGSHENIDKREGTPQKVNLAQKDKLCAECGYASHKNQACPVEGKKCKQCGKLNQFARVCLSNKPTKRASIQMTPRKVNSLECEDSYFLHTVLSGHTKKSGAWKTELQIEGEPVVCNLDTGANCLVMPLQQPRAITCKELEPSSTFLSS